MWFQKHEGVMNLSGYLPRMLIILPWAVVADDGPVMVRLLAQSTGAQSLLREPATCWDSRGERRILELWKLQSHTCPDKCGTPATPSL